MTSKSIRFGADKSVVANVLDSTAFISDVPFQSSDEEFFTTKEILSEVRNEHVSTLVESRKLHVLEPSATSVSKAATTAKESGDYETMTEADVSVIALAITVRDELGMKSRVITDDFAVENVCSRLSIPFRPTMTKGVRKELQWVAICPGCGKESSSMKKYVNCPICGTKLRRKPSPVRRILS
jgi:UPF0271 protein